MNQRDKTLYRQIHPAKLATDWLTAFVAAYLLWLHQLVLALLVGVVPAVLASALVLTLVDLKSY